MSLLRHMTQVNERDSSTRYCSCGSSVTWEGFNWSELDPWMDIHSVHGDKPRYIYVRARGWSKP